VSVADFPDAPVVVVAPFLSVVVVVAAAWQALSFLAHFAVACCVATPAVADPVAVVPVGGPAFELPELFELPAAAADDDEPEGSSVTEWDPALTWAGASLATSRLWAVDRAGDPFWASSPMAMEATATSPNNTAPVGKRRFR
jgi:hypothetical protein